MSLPIFFTENLIGSSDISLGAETSKHIVQVLRMSVGEKLILTDGKGKMATATIAEANKKSCTVTVGELTETPSPQKQITIAVSLLKNPSRFEWFLEKATEVGVSRIIPLICSRTERQHFKADRWSGILQSAMLQSRRVWMPQLSEPLGFKDAVFSSSASVKLIAHCESDEHKKELPESSSGDIIILIGPEGDFTSGEIATAVSKGFMPVSLGDYRLRTETAAMVAAVLLCKP